MSNLRNVRLEFGPLSTDRPCQGAKIEAPSFVWSVECGLCEPRCEHWMVPPHTPRRHLIPSVVCSWTSRREQSRCAPDSLQFPFFLADVFKPSPFPPSLNSSNRLHCRPRPDSSLLHRSLLLIPHTPTHPIAMCIRVAAANLLDFGQRQVDRVVSPESRQNTYSQTKQFAAARPLLFVRS